jgi:predicted SAM-dependent methyltransferase
VGCGPNIEPGFINLDYEWRPGLDICCDIRRGIALPDACLDGIFTEHCLEHVSFEECLGSLREFYRLLVKGGTVRIVVPDGGLYLRLYARQQGGTGEEFPYVGPEGLQDRVKDSAIGFTPMMAVNRIFRGYGHQFCYDHDTLRNMLNHVGFKNIEDASFRVGRMQELLIESELRRPQSLYIEATK